MNLNRIHYGITSITMTLTYIYLLNWVVVRWVIPSTPVHADVHVCGFQKVRKCWTCHSLCTAKCLLIRARSRPCFYATGSRTLIVATFVFILKASGEERNFIHIYF